MKKRCLLFALFAALLIGCATAEDFDLPKQYAKNGAGEAVVDDVIFYGETPKDNARVFYEIFVGSFSDSNGDGVGDLRGIINRMDYLNDGDPASGTSLGVEGLWLTPIFTSPSYHKYDVADFYTIDPAFGTMEDLQELIALCHERDVKLILDLPINHTSTQNAWFEKFKKAHLLHNEGNAYYDYYTWVPSDGTFPAGRHFSRVSGTDIAVECNFSDSMPELNYDNTLVRQTMLDVAKFYLALGVDGFRFDAAKYLYYGDHQACVDFWVWYMAELKTLKPDIYTIAEVWDSDGTTDKYEPAFNCFNFTASQAEGMIATTAAGGNVNQYTAYLQRYIERIHGINPESMPVLFIANHDTDRAAGYLTVASGRMQMAANLYILSPGSPFIYYGEEIGIRGSRGGANTDANRRLAMLWGDGDTVRDPIGTTYEGKNQTPYTVQDLLGSSTGILTYYKRLLMLRKANPEIARGVYHALTLQDTKLGGFTSTWNGATVAVLHNTTQRDMQLDLTTVPELCDMNTLQYIGAGEATLEGNLLTIEGQTSAILRVQ